MYVDISTLGAKYWRWYAHTTVSLQSIARLVRLPKDVAFPDDVKDVDVLRDGKRRVIGPANAVWKDFFDWPGIDLPPRRATAASEARRPLMLRYLLDTNLCIRVLRDRALRAYPR